MRPKLIAALMAVVALGLAACDDDKKQQRAGATPPEATIAEARRVAEAQLRSRMRIVGDMRLRAVQVYRQQIPETFAVCGQINPTGAASDPFIPWVAVVTLKEGRAEPAELTLGASSAEASRVYIEMVDRCFDEGGPSAARRQAPPPLPPLPSGATLVQQQARPSATASPPASPASAVTPPPLPAPVAEPNTTARTVTTTSSHPVNIRSQPGGGGAIVRIVPRASVLRVFGEAPGGWLEVGEDQPFGWVHGSMLDR